MHFLWATQPSIGPMKGFRVSGVDLKFDFNEKWQNENAQEVHRACYVKFSGATVFLMCMIEWGHNRWVYCQHNTAKNHDFDSWMCALLLCVFYIRDIIYLGKVYKWFH